MSRHRNVRSMNYEEEYDGYYDVYGHSVEDDYCVSPSTAAEFMYDRNQHHELSSFMGEESIVEEIEEAEEESDQPDSLHSSSSFTSPQLSELDSAKLNSCLEEMRSVLGDSTPERVMVEAVIANNFDYERALNHILVLQEAPKPQRMPRANRRSRGSCGRESGTANTGEPPPPSTTAGPSGDPPVKFSIGGDTTSEQPELTAGGPAVRMTFSSGRQSHSGFTPEKRTDPSNPVDESAIEDVKRDLMLADSVNRDLRVDEGARASSSPSRSPNRTVRKDTTEGAATPVHKSASKAKLHDRLDVLKEYEKRKEGGKDYINLVVIGHVDAGKSTLMGHVLFQLGFVNKKTMHKYEQESKKVGKASFAYAWVLDETEEERSRGVTMDVAQTRFETPGKVVTLLDAPGHKDFIPNMITGAAQADAAVLVVNSTRGEFETGFEAGGQTREHAMLIRSLGVSQVTVAVNKMDTVDWSEERYQDIIKKLGHFLRQTGFKEADVSFIPCSGLSGENLVKPPTEPRLAAWYKGPTLVDQIDRFKPPERQIDKPFRMCVGDVFKGMGSGFSVSGTVQAGSVQPGDRLQVMPQSEGANVKSISIDEAPVQYAVAGDNAVITVTGIDMMNITIGSILCDPTNPIQTASRLQARIVVFNIDVPITRGFPVVFHYQSLSEPAHIRKLISQLHKSTGEVIKKKPRCLTKNMNAVVELEIGRPICVELYKDFKELGRFMLRYAGSTIAAGLVTEIGNSKNSKND